MRSEIKFITPEIAAKLLKANKINRKISQHRVEFYADEMKKGLWKLTDQGISIGLSSNVLNGQHRLLAVIKSGVSIQFYVTYDIDDNTFDVYDTGKNRSASDVFSINNVKSASQITSGLKSALAMKKGYFGDKATCNQNISHTELYEIYLENKKFYDSVCKKSNIWYNSFSKVLVTSYIYGFYILFYEKHQNKADEFFEMLCRNITGNQSIDLLRKKLIEYSIQSKKQTINVRYRNALIIKAWNNYILKKDVKILNFNSEIEEFPKIM